MCHFHHIPQNGQGAMGHSILEHIPWVIYETGSVKHRRTQCCSEFMGLHTLQSGQPTASHPESHLIYFTPEMTRRAKI